MKWLESIGTEARRSLGEPGPGPSDDALLTALAARHRRRSNWSRSLAAGAAAALLVAGAMVLPVRGPEPVAQAGSAEPESAPPRSDPMAAIILESARVRLDGIGDPAVARIRLEEVIELYPGTDSAIEAEKLLEGLERSN